MARPVEDLTVRFFKHVKKTETCWLWTGTVNSYGYGRIHVAGKLRFAHRISYRDIHGHALPDDLVIDHVCRNKLCVNPAHLRAVTPRVNALENSVGMGARNVVKTTCPKGHQYDRTYANGQRWCSQCRKEHNARNNPKRKFVKPNDQSFRGSDEQRD